MIVLLLKNLHYLSLYFKFNISPRLKLLTNNINALHIEYETKPQHQQQNIFSARKTTSTSLSREERVQGCRLGLDSHADISCAGRHARILEIIEGQSCTVRPFNDAYKPL